MVSGGGTALYLKYLRLAEYYAGKSGLFNKLRFYRYYHKLNRYNLKLGYDIACGVFGYGLVLPHIGTKVVGGGNKIGNYAVLHTSTCITAGNKVIGDGLYLSAGAKLIKDIHLGNNVTVSVNSVVNRDFPEDNILLAGMPAKVVKTDYETWFDRDKYNDRVKKVEALKQQMGL